MKKWLLGAIILLGLILRLINLSSSPPGFNADEAALGYNAYSILKTSKDEWGQSFPLVFKSFSDYKPGLYVYLDIPFVAILGLNELAVRLPSILLGTITILLVYSLTKKLFASETSALASAFLLSVSPWHLHFSRGAWESNVATFFITLGIFCFIKGLESKYYLLCSVVSFIASVYTYQSPRAIIPILALFLMISFRKKIIIKKNLIAFVVGGILILPLTTIVFSDQGLSRFEGLSIFNDPGPSLRVNVDRGEHQDPNSFTAVFYHNKIASYGINFLSHYLDHYSPDFLFVNGDFLGRNKVPEMGQMYIFEIVTILVGISILHKYSKKNILLYWLMVAPLAAALTYQTPSALRSENMVIPLTILSGLGLGLLIDKARRAKKLVKWGFLSMGFLVAVFFIARYLDLYYIHLPKHYALEWEYGFSEMVNFLSSQESAKVRITDRYDQPYILVLFYSKYDPSIYQSQAKQSVKTRYGFSTVTSFNKFQFGSISKNDVGQEKNTIYVGTKQELDNLTPLKVINFPNGEEALRIVKSSN